jgi:hypothetical protein
MVGVAPEKKYSRVCQYASRLSLDVKVNSCRARGVKSNESRLRDERGCGAGSSKYGWLSMAYVRDASGVEPEYLLIS